MQVKAGRPYCCSLCELLAAEFDRAEAMCRDQYTSPEAEALLTDAWTALVAAGDAFAEYRQAVQALSRLRALRDVS
ncbi:hypothetical protein [Amycolatopsis dongchuanensis]|uniref:hypothetical protein n=1 Tax=Amycolatopsis dongchuanensis TaxID=1070866 RepID=UPI0031F8B52C